ncbi:MAG: hypothetical protein Q8O25_12195 [Sulfurisoma sp.]|nr:hypothetical protein [Sulfurisoma sp.]
MIDLSEQEFVARLRDLEWVAAAAGGLDATEQTRVALESFQRHPFAVAAGRYADNCGAALGLSAAAATNAARLNLAGHARGFIQHGSPLVRELDAAWARRCLDAGGGPADVALPERGTLVLTWHGPEYHLLFCCLGLLGARVFPVVAPESAAMFHRHVAGYLKRLHDDTRRNFGGGDYVFIEDGEATARQVGEKLAAGATVVALMDNHFHDGRGQGKFSGEIFGRSTTPRAGVIKLAIAGGYRILVASNVFDWAAGRHCLLARAVSENSMRGVIDAYFRFLAEAVARRPECWDGWYWFDALPAA